MHAYNLEIEVKKKGKEERGEREDRNRDGRE